MPEILRFVKGLTSWVWTQRAKILVLILVMTMVVPQPAKGQFIDVAAIVCGDRGDQYRDHERHRRRIARHQWCFGCGQRGFERHSELFPEHRSTRRTRSTALAAWSVRCRGFTTSSGVLVNLNVASATLANPRQLEAVLLSTKCGKHRPGAQPVHHRLSAYTAGD